MFRNGQKHWNVAYAIVTRILDRDEVPQELLDALSEVIEYYQKLKDRDELRMPGE